MGLALRKEDFATPVLPPAPRLRVVSLHESDEAGLKREIRRFTEGMLVWRSTTRARWLSWISATRAQSEDFPAQDIGPLLLDTIDQSLALLEIERSIIEPVFSAQPSMAGTMAEIKASPLSAAKWLRKQIEKADEACAQASAAFRALEIELKAYRDEIADDMQFEACISQAVDAFPAVNAYLAK